MESEKASFPGPLSSSLDKGSCNQHSETREMQTRRTTVINKTTVIAPPPVVAAPSVGFGVTRQQTDGCFGVIIFVTITITIVVIATTSITIVAFIMIVIFITSTFLLIIAMFKNTRRALVLFVEVRRNPHPNPREFLLEDVAFGVYKPQDFLLQSHLNS